MFERLGNRDFGGKKTQRTWSLSFNIQRIANGERNQNNSVLPPYSPHWIFFEQYWEATTWLIWAQYHEELSTRIVRRQGDWTCWNTGLQYLVGVLGNGLWVVLKLTSSWDLWFSGSLCWTWVTQEICEPADKHRTSSVWWLCWHFQETAQEAKKILLLEIRACVCSISEA